MNILAHPLQSFAPDLAALRLSRVQSGFDYPVTLASSTTYCDIYYATSLGTLGAQCAANLRPEVDGQYSTCFEWFGMINQPRAKIVISPLSTFHDGTGGAYHYSCVDPTLYCDLDQNNYKRTLALFIAELMEVFMGTQNGGTDCGANGGEALSRFGAELACPGVLDDFATVPTWLNGTRVDWINHSDPTDGNAVSTGCALAFLYWLNEIGGHSPSYICQSPGVTMADTYRALTSDTRNPFTLFMQDVNQKYPLGQPSNLAIDNLFQ
jgi:hypothetical protein